MSDDSSTRKWRGQTLDDRALARRENLLHAGFQLLGDGGAAAVTMRAVCRLAELSPRYFYESFSDTDELILSVYDACNAELGESIVSIGSQDNLHQTIAAAVRAAFTYFEDPRRVRILLREPISGDLLGRRRAGVISGFLTGLAGVLLPAVPGKANLAGADLAMAASALSGALGSLALDWSDGRLDAEPDQIVSYATLLIVDALDPARSSIAEQ